MECKVYSSLPEISSKLDEMGLSWSLLLGIAQYVQALPKTFSKHDPYPMKGMYLWGKGLGRLRELLEPTGWSDDDGGNYFTVVNPTGEFCIACASGNSNTGQVEKTPSTKSAKGAKTIEAVWRNQQSFISIDPSFPRNRQTRPTWFFMSYDDEHELRSELSLAGYISSSGLVSDWIERIILPAQRKSPPVSLSVPKEFLKTSSSSPISETKRSSEPVKFDVRRRPAKL